MEQTTGKRILVVDDEADIRAYLSMALEDAGFEVDTAEDGVQALEKVKENPPDLVSLDLVMPKGSGAQFHRAMNKDEKLAKIPILVVTGHARDDLGKVDFEELTMSGSGVYLEKPVTPAKYVSAVCRLLDIPEPGQESSDPAKLREELKKSLDDADPEDLKRALEALKKK